MNEISDDVASLLLRRWVGTGKPRLIGEGMEGSVYEIGESSVAKIWFSGTKQAIQRNAKFYDALALKPVSFATPKIEEICEIGAHTVSIERRLNGISLAQAVASGRVTRLEARATFVRVLSELSGSGRLPEARELTVLGESEPLYRRDEDFPDALASLAARRIEKYAHVLGKAVEALDDKAAALAVRLREADSGRRTVVHGDMILGNVLIDDRGRPSAVLDWGFLSTEGDPVFDAAIAAAIFDMYSEEALTTELAMYDLIQSCLGHDRNAMLIYRAAYSFITSNAYDAEGLDGHFAWCVAALNRTDVTQALLG